MSETKALKWWGWGLEGERYDLPDATGFWSFLEDHLGALPQSPRIASPKDIVLPPSRLSPEDLDDIKKIFGEGGVSTDTVDRVVHAVGKSYVDLLRLQQGRIEAAPDVIVFPEREEQIQTVLESAASEGWAVIPFGGGTSVVGGVESPSGTHPVLTMNLRRMNRVLNIDRDSRIARVQCGITGPQLESALNERGLTLGHFPQSFEFSTLGGWIATRAAGQNSTKYGKIDHMVISLRMVRPCGVLEPPTVPADATGPSLLHCLIGSEGTLGVITQAVLRLHPLPTHRAFAAYLFPDFDTGLAAVQQMMKTDVRPAVLRLSDPEETATAWVLSKSPRLSLKKYLGQRYIRSRGLELERSALLIMIFEGQRKMVSVGMREARRFLKSGVYLGRHPARLWMRSRFRHPYLRDELMERSVMVDTLETAGPWERLPALYSGVRQAITESIMKTAPGALVLTHLSHAYPDGASLYFMFMARQQPGRELEQWEVVKEAATEAILEHGGALSHHHGIGNMHKPWLPRYLGKRGLAFLVRLKREFDPNHVMNPGKLVGP